MIGLGLVAQSFNRVYDFDFDFLNGDLFCKDDKQLLSK